MNRSIEDEVYELRELVRSLSLSVQYSGAEPLETFYAKYSIAGQQRLALKISLMAILDRAEGKAPREVQDLDLVEIYPGIREACQSGPIDIATAIHIIGEITGNQARAVEFIQAHARRGLGAKGHTALGL